MSSLMRCSRPLACTNKRLYKAQWDQIAKIRQKLDQQKLVKLIDVSNACNSLTKFCIWSEWNDRKRNYVNLLKLAWKNLWNHFRWTYFWLILSTWDHCAERGRGNPNEFCPRPCPFFSFCIYIYCKCENKQNKEYVRRVWGFFEENINDYLLVTKPIYLFFWINIFFLWNFRKYRLVVLCSETSQICWFVYIH